MTGPELHRTLRDLATAALILLAFVTLVVWIA